MSVGGPPSKQVQAGTRLVGLVAGAIALAFGLLVVAGARSAPSASGLIAFTRPDGIYVMDSDGTGVRPLRRGRFVSVVNELAWSPDGRRLAFIRDGAIWTMGVNGKDLARVLVEGRIGSAGITAFMSTTWSPDGGQIAFTAYDPTAAYEGKRDIWIMNADGSALRPLRTPDRWENDVDWSPSGREFAVVIGGYFPHLWVINTDGSNGRLLTKGGYTGGFATAPDWSPDGRRIAFTRPAHGSYLAALWVTDRSGRTKVRLGMTTGPFLGGPTWSPDGRRIAFPRGTDAITTIPPFTSVEIYVMKSDGTAVTRLTHNRFAEANLAWQPAGLP